MENIYYNGIVSFHFSVSIKSNKHQICLDVSKKIKDYLSAWSYGCASISESKSARKGDVLTREIQTSFEDYPVNVIAFREGLRCICFHYNLYSDGTSVKITDHGTSPKDSHMNIFK